MRGRYIEKLREREREGGGGSKEKVRVLVISARNSYILVVSALQFPHTRESKSNTVRKGGRDYESGCGFDCSLIVLIHFMAADVVISKAGAMPGDTRQEA